MDLSKSTTGHQKGHRAPGTRVLTFDSSHFQKPNAKEKWRPYHAQDHDGREISTAMCRSIKYNTCHSKVPLLSRRRLWSNEAITYSLRRGSVLYCLQVEDLPEHEVKCSDNHRDIPAEMVHQSLEASFSCSRTVTASGKRGVALILNGIGWLR